MTRTLRPSDPQIQLDCFATLKLSVIINPNLSAERWESDVHREPVEIEVGIRSGASDNGSASGYCPEIFRRLAVQEAHHSSRWVDDGQMVSKEISLSAD